MSLKDKVIFITGASRGIGREIALRAAKDGANIVIASKTAEPHPKLQGTIYTVSSEVEKAGGKALPIQLDVRNDSDIDAAVQKTVDHFGGIDILINNASAIDLSSIQKISMKRFDLMMSVNMRATFACARACIPHLKKGTNPHILTLSPPLNMKPKWFAPHLAYTISKYGMSLCTLGISEEFKNDGIAANSLWPKSIIATAAVENNFPSEILKACRRPAIVADAAYLILTQDSRKVTGNFFIDEEVLRSHGVTDFSSYAMNPNIPLISDLFLDK